MDDSKSYLLRRQSQSRLMIKNAASSMARIAHETMVDEYASRLRQMADAEAKAYEAKAIAQPLLDKLRDN